MGIDKDIGPKHEGVIVTLERGSVGYKGGHAWTLGYVPGAEGRRVFRQSTRRADDVPFRIPPNHVGWWDTQGRPAAPRRFWRD